MAAEPTPLSVRVQAVRAEALDVLSFELCAEGGGLLPAFTAGSHIDVAIPTAAGPLLRQYSLCNDPEERQRYVIGVGRDVASRGGSVALHDGVRAGALLRIGMPRNNFALDEAAPLSVLVAGGIGITPMLAMARRLARLGRPWTLYHCVRSPCRAAFAEELQALAPPGGQGRVVTVVDGLPGAARLDLAALVREAPQGAHFYCCGPVPMLEAFGRATQGLPDARVHVEWFSAPAPAAAAEVPAGSFSVQLKRRNRRFEIPADKTILEVLLDGGIDVDHSCREGLCGTCETRVLAGTPDHRDPILAGRTNPPQDRMLVCVSRCTGPALVLDL